MNISLEIIEDIEPSVLVPLTEDVHKKPSSLDVMKIQIPMMRSHGQSAGFLAYNRDRSVKHFLKHNQELYSVIASNGTGKGYFRARINGGAFIVEQQVPAENW